MIVSARQIMVCVLLIPMVVFLLYSMYMFCFTPVGELGALLGVVGGVSTLLAGITIFVAFGVTFVYLWDNNPTINLKRKPKLPKAKVIK